ncbi:MAG: metallophosphoesterase family protein [Clostridia bacterium]|nr:metallophosphoesterase family protein [Clostridia bacterium]
MRTLVIADIHGNFPALEAVLATPEAAACQRIISLGDQVNFGPQPREVMARLTALNAIMLRGNHEERLLQVNAPEYAGYNWVLQRWTHRQLTGVPLDHPIDYAEGRKLFTHGTPGEPFHLIETHEVPAQLEQLPAGVTHLFSGHNHFPWLVEHRGRTACNPGSLGMLEDGTGGSAPFVVMEEEGDRINLTRHKIPYDTAALKRAFITTGCAAAAPQMARIVLHTMLTGEYQATLKMVRFIASLGDLGNEAVWQKADALYPWRERLSTAEYWKNLEEELL